MVAISDDVQDEVLESVVVDEVIDGQEEEEELFLMQEDTEGRKRLGSSERA